MPDEAAGRADGRSGPRVAALFHSALALNFLVAWLSLGAQVSVLIGSRGLLPIGDHLELLRARTQVGFFRFPTLFWWGDGDGLLAAGIAVGVLLAVAALLRVGSRLCFAVSTVLYLSYTVACRDFLSFQWDNLLLECGVLAAFLPVDRRAPIAHFAFRLLIFKLYFESGIAKYQSHLGDWLDGSAMTYYYETAPIPTALAWFAHALPAGWHHFESWATLALELGVPFLVFLSRPFRLAAAAALSAFQLINILTANYGFFAYLALTLHIFLLGDADVERAAARVRAFAPAARLSALLSSRRPRNPLGARLDRIRAHIVGRFPERWLQRSRAWSGPFRRSTAVILLVFYAAISLAGALRAFAANAPEIDALEKLEEGLSPFRLVNVYHLFGHITRERYEAEFQTYDGAEWEAHDFHEKPGRPSRRPPFVAPHQPRVDFLLWFYGLDLYVEASGAVAPRPPEYVARLLVRLCSDPSAIQGLFVDRLPASPTGVRIVFYRYDFTTPAERRATGDWWKRVELASTPAFRCRPRSLPSNAIP